MSKLKSSFQECKNQLKEKGSDKAKLIQVKCSDKIDQELASALPFVQISELKDTLQLHPQDCVVVGIGKESVVVSY